ncbi:hypothetical protein NC653_028721 [Populus alba x Populus x berolinensis]|uniref:Uncharacterized protein n=1 Tax=Populus alba x Populus x berolinensis TaxID=444605 RepID=A0AAD6Q4E9_9ROSI|nr:hypothetical protein NC653_028721 [Populus alba x Populus x berolinensis]
MTKFLIENCKAMIRTRGETREAEASFLSDREAGDLAHRAMVQFLHRSFLLTYSPRPVPKMRDTCGSKFPLTGRARCSSMIEGTELPKSSCLKGDLDLICICS